MHVQITLNCFQEKSKFTILNGKKKLSRCDITPMITHDNYSISDSIFNYKKEYFVNIPYQKKNYVIKEKRNDVKNVKLS